MHNLFEAAHHRKSCRKTKVILNVLDNKPASRFLNECLTGCKPFRGYSLRHGNPYKQRPGAEEEQVIPFKDRI
jgi:hypothetical protein